MIAYIIKDKLSLGTLTRQLSPRVDSVVIRSEDDPVIDGENEVETPVQSDLTLSGKSIYLKLN